MLLPALEGDSNVRPVVEGLSLELPRELRRLICAPLEPPGPASDET